MSIAAALALSAAGSPTSSVPAGGADVVRGDAVRGVEAAESSASHDDSARLIGRVVFTTAPGRWFAVLDPADTSHDGVAPRDGRFIWAAGAKTEAELDDVGIEWTFPVVGSAGPLSPANDLDSCLTQSSKWGPYGFELADCADGDDQRFEWVEDATQLRNVATRAFVGTDSTGYDDILHPTAASATPAVIDSSLLRAVPPTGESAPVRITSPTEGQILTTRRPVFSGTGDPGASIEVTGPMGRIASTTVVGSAWSVASDVDLPDGTYTITVRQRTVEGRVSTVNR
jgi:hypothetical protein